MPLILPGNVASATASTTYDVDNSCRFNDGDAPKLNRTLGTATSRKKWTMSFWVKRGTLTNQMIMTTASANSQIKFDDNHRFQVNDVTTIVYVTNRVFRDVSAWYHIVIAVDTTDGTAGDRIKIYVNGVEETSFATETNPSVNYDCDINNAIDHKFASYDGSTDHALDAYLAQVVFIDGQQLAPTSFGEFDSDSPTIWKPIDVSGLTFGTNGFYLDFEDSADLGDDESGNTNDFTETNLAATDQASDSPTNNFATMNPLVVINGSTFSEGNCKIVTGSSPYSYDVSTIGVANGKWYVEAKYGGSSDDATFGIAGRTATDTTHELGNYNDTWSYYTGTGASNIRNNNSNSSYGATYTTNDIIGLALDLTNNKLYFSKNGAWQNSGDPESGATGTGAVDITAASSVTDGVYYIAVGDYDGGASVTWEINFGNPSYTGTDQDDDNGYGSFEYDPPSGYLALCTKNLGSDGG